MGLPILFDGKRPPQSEGPPELGEHDNELLTSADVVELTGGGQVK